MPIPVLTVAQMRAWEAATWAAEIRSEDVIAKVGQKIGAWLLAHSNADDFLVFLNGRGHNGDDARAAAEWIGARRKQKSISVLDPNKTADEIKQELKQAARSSPQVWVIDALYGIGLNRQLDAAWCRLIEAINLATRSQRFRVVAIDVPSGLSSDHGDNAGALVVATDTLTVGAPKRGLIGLGAAGRVEVMEDVGLVEGDAKSRTDRDPSPKLQWLTGSDFAEFPLKRPPAAHKGTMGHLVIIAGSVGYHGAAVLAARAALRAGPGLISVVTDPAAYLPVASQLAQPMVHPWTERFALPETTTAVVIGPGLASRELPPGLVQWARSLWQEFPGPVLADANAMSWVCEISANSGPRIITPHPGEASRLLQTSTGDVQSDRVAAALKLCAKTGATTVLKGFHTLIANSEFVLVNSSGNAGLAQGGSGDVLSGFTGGWLARKVPVEQAVPYAVWEHGAAADRLEAGGNWTTEDLISELQ